MTTIADRIAVSSVVESAIVSETAFDLKCFLYDTEDVPVDYRYRLTTPSGYETDLTSATAPYLFAQNFWSQPKQAQQLMIGRWIATASNPYYYMTDYETNYLVWKGISNGSFNVTDGTNTDAVTGCDFTAITAIDQVATVLTAKIQAIGAPNVTGLDTSTFEIDKVGRLRLKMSTSGASAATVSITSNVTGTDLSASTYMNIASNAASVAGLDAEEPTAALDAISQLNDTYYSVSIRGESSAQQVALSTYIEGKRKALTLVITDSNAKNAGSTTDTPYLIKQLSNDKTFCIYTEQATEYPDAAVDGYCLPFLAGSISWAYQEGGLTGVTPSKLSGGSAINLNSTERAALEGKQCNYIENVGGVTYCYNGVGSGDLEMRQVIGIDSMKADIETDLFARRINSKIWGYNNATLAQIEAVDRKHTDRYIGRGLIDDDPGREPVYNYPKASSFTTAQRATREISLEDVSQKYLLGEVLGVDLTLNFSI